MQVRRTEYKFPLNQRERALMVEKLDRLLPRDIHSASPDGYEIRTLYFDTVADRCCAEKDDGMEVHEKIRARIYGTDDSVIKLESKRKTGEFQVKQTMLIDRDTLSELCRGSYGVLLNYEDPLAPYLYGKLARGMLPRSIVQYQRLSYCLDVNNTRITFDSDIRATEASLDLFREPLLTHPILPADTVIMEVKFNNFLLGYVRDALSSIRQLPSSYSKYRSGRTFSRELI